MDSSNSSSNSSSNPTSTSSNPTSNSSNPNPNLDIGHKKGPTHLFSGIQEYKRDNSSAAEARRASLEDMSAKPKGGILASAWNSTFKGGNGNGGAK